MKSPAFATCGQPGGLDRISTWTPLASLSLMKVAARRQPSRARHTGNDLAMVVVISIVLETRKCMVVIAFIKCIFAAIFSIFRPYFHWKYFFSISDPQFIIFISCNICFRALKFQNGTEGRVVVFEMGATTFGVNFYPKRKVRHLFGKRERLPAVLFQNICPYHIVRMF